MTSTPRAIAAAAPLFDPTSRRRRGRRRPALGAGLQASPEAPPRPVLPPPLGRRALLVAPGNVTPYLTQPPGLPGQDDTWAVPAGGGSLFGPSGRPRLDEVDEGTVGDCYFDAAVGSLVLAADAFVMESFAAAGNIGDDPLYNVRLFAGTQPTWLPVDSAQLRRGDQPEGNRAPDAQGQAVLWAVLLEKAYVKLVMAHPWLGNGGQAAGYAAIVGGQPAQALEALTGAAAQVQRPDAEGLRRLGAQVRGHTSLAVFVFVDGASLAGQAGYVPANRSVVWPGIGSLQAQDDATLHLTGSDGTDVWLTDNHAYTVLGPAADGGLTLRNPWGFGPHGGDANFSAGLPLLAQAAAAVVVGPAPGHVPPAPPAPFVPGPSPIGGGPGGETVLAICVGAALLVGAAAAGGLLLARRWRPRPPVAGSPAAPPGAVPV